MSMDQSRLARLLISENATLLDAIRTVDFGELGIALMVDEDRKLVGVVTDRDIRRATLDGLAKADLITPYVTRSPVVARVGEDDESIRTLMLSSSKLQIPVVDAANHVVDLRILSEFMG